MQLFAACFVSTRCTIVMEGKDDYSEVKQYEYETLKKAKGLKKIGGNLSQKKWLKVLSLKKFWLIVGLAVIVIAVAVILAVVLTTKGEHFYLYLFI